jgi:ArsR family transcriptional regulator
VLDVDLIKALGNEKRLQVLEWLRDPVANFPPQRDGDLIEDGVCALFIAEKLGVSPPTCGEHLKLLSRAGLIRGKKIKQWVFYKRDEDHIAQAKEALARRQPGSARSASSPSCTPQPARRPAPRSASTRLPLGTPD